MILATSTILLSLLILLITTLLSTLHRLTRRTPLPPNAPSPTTSTLYPILGALSFFTNRHTFHTTSAHSSPTGHFTYYVGATPVIGLSGPSGRSTFFESRGLSLGAGYERLFAAGPTARPEDEDAESSRSFHGYFMKRLAFLVRSEQLEKRLPLLVRDSRQFVDGLAASLSGAGASEGVHVDEGAGRGGKAGEKYGVIDPFQSIYALVFRLTVRTVGCNDIASSPALLARVLSYFEQAERGASTLSLILPWLPTPGKLIRNYACMRLYLIIKGIADGRRRTGARDGGKKVDDDPLQYLINSGDTTLDMTKFMIAAFFAGILNSGVNAAAVICYLAADEFACSSEDNDRKSWQSRCLAELNTLADMHTTHPDAKSPTTPLLSKLAHVPLSAWENSLPVLDACFRDSIRLQLLGTGFRRNVSGRDIEIVGGGAADGDTRGGVGGGSGGGKGGKGKEKVEVIPAGAYATWHFQERHLDPGVYPVPNRWDPGRYLGGGLQEDEKEDPYKWVGFGAGMHPCAGMRFARLEQNIITAFFLARFRLVSLNDAKTGQEMESLPVPDVQSFSAGRTEGVRVRFVGR